MWCKRKLPGKCGGLSEHHALPGGANTLVHAWESVSLLRHEPQCGPAPKADQPFRAPFSEPLASPTTLRR